MPREFDTPFQFKADTIGTWKRIRQESDGRTRSFTPLELNLGPVTVLLARHFGFCFGVENAVEIAYRAIADHPNQPLYLLSQMIHNQRVNDDLLSRGVKFLFETDGTTLIPIDDMPSNAVVILPAFGAPVSLVELLKQKKPTVTLYDATCPFVEKVWRRAQELGKRSFAVVIHGKHYHEETRATFSHAELTAPCIIIRDQAEASVLGEFILGTRTESQVFNFFEGRMSSNFKPALHLFKFGVVNQTTMLAEETKAISSYLRDCLLSRFGEDDIAEHFADTRDTLCYATSENQRSIEALLEHNGDFALVVGGFNSSNTAHLAALCRKKLRTFHIEEAASLLCSEKLVECVPRNYGLGKRKSEIATGWLPEKRPLRILLSAGASTPDSIVDEVISRLAEIIGVAAVLPEAWSKVLNRNYRNDCSDSEQGE